MVGVPHARSESIVDRPKANECAPAADRDLMVSAARMRVRECRVIGLPVGPEVREQGSLEVSLRVLEDMDDELRKGVTPTNSGAK